MTHISSSAGIYSMCEEQCPPSMLKPATVKKYSRSALGYVVSGSFQYRASSVSATAVAGSVILGNSGETFSCQNVSAIGNRRHVVYFEDAFLQRVADDCALGHTRFPIAVAAPGSFSAMVFGYMRWLSLNTIGTDEVAYELAIAAWQTSLPAAPLAVSSRNRNRILSVVRHLETSFTQPCAIKELADFAQLSPFHFLRIFRRVTGQSPTQYVIHTRLRAAAGLLLHSGARISDVALETGFNDISHFNASFRRVFGRCPSQWRTFEHVRPSFT